MNYPTKNATQSLRSSAMRSPRGKNVRTTFSPKDSKHKKEVKNGQEEANIERGMKNFSNQEAKKKDDKPQTQPIPLYFHPTLWRY